MASIEDKNGSSYVKQSKDPNESSRGGGGFA